MPEKKNVVQERTSEAPERCETLYSAEELARAASRFGTQEECVIAALNYYKKDSATIKEAESLIKKFLIKEVN